MLTISKPLSSNQAQTYHKQEFTAVGQSYYKQGGAVEGEWQGKLADEFGLAGLPVDGKQFALLTEGKNPQTEDQLVRSKAAVEYKNADGTVTKTVEHRAGWDATFSAPKSVSLAALVGGDDRVREAHREAVAAALTELERYTQARIGGNNPAETTGRFIAAKFEHDTARPVDGYAAPQLHTHAVIFNMTQRDDGKMRSLQPQSLFDTQSYATAYYQSELTVRLRNLGYELSTGKSGAPEIKGFTQEYLDASSRRSQQIKEHLAKTGFQGPAAAQIAAHATRDGKLLLSPEEVLAAHRQLAAEHGNQAQKIVAEARERGRTMAQVPGREIDPGATAGTAVAYAKEHIFEREAVADRRTILRDAMRRGMGETTPAEIKAEFERRRELGEFRQAGGRTYDTERRYTTPETLAAERANIAIMKTGQNSLEPMLSERKAEKQAQAKSFLNPTQQAVIKEVLTSRDRIHGLQGLAGTGKTTTLDSIRRGAKKAGYTVEGFAPTSKAAGQLREAGIEAGTLQGFLVRKQDQNKDPNEKHLYMLDESSLASSRQMRDFLRKLEPNDRVLVIGDTGQHQGVDAGKPFEQMQQAGMKTAQLSEIMRQKDPELRRAVEHLAKGQTAEGVKLLGEQGRIQEIVDKTERTVAIAKDYMAKPGSTIIVSPDNASRRELNQAVRVEMREAGKLAKDGKEYRTLIPRGDMTGADRAWAARYAEGDVVRYTRGSKALGLETGTYATVRAVDAAANVVTVTKEDGQRVAYDPTRLRGVSVYRERSLEFAKGDRLQFTAPDKELGVANRDLGTVTKAAANKITVKLDGKKARTVSFDPNQMRHIDHGYAVTSHSSQGLTVDRVLVNIDADMAKSLINTRLAYVAVSRAAQDARIYVSKADGLDKQLASNVTKTTAIEFGSGKHTGPPIAAGPKQKNIPLEALDPSAERRYATSMLGTETANIGAKLLEQQGHITIEPDRAARFARIVEDYANRQEGAIAVVTTAAQRNELNRLIRAELQQTKTIALDSRSLPVLVEKAGSRKTATTYTVGDRIEFRTGNPERSIQANTSATVRAVDQERNRITIERPDGELTTYNPARLKAAQESRVYGEESREIAIGERIRLNVDHKAENIRAGDLAQVEAIRDIGALQVRLQDGRVMELNPGLAQHIEYGYAVTSVRPGNASHLLIALDSPGQVERGSPLLKAVNLSENAKFYARDRFAFYEPKTPAEIEQYIARTPETTQGIAKIAAPRAGQAEDRDRGFLPSVTEAAERVYMEAEHVRRHLPLERALSSVQAEGFGWLAETGTIQTYRHQQTGRNIHIDAASGQFYDQQRAPISRDAALAYALPSNQQVRLPAIERVPQITQTPDQDHDFGLSL